MKYFATPISLRESRAVRYDKLQAEGYVPSLKAAYHSRVMSQLLSEPLCISGNLTRFWSIANLPMTYATEF